MSRNRIVHRVVVTAVVSLAAGANRLPAETLPSCGSGSCPGVSAEAAVATAGVDGIEFAALRPADAGAAEAPNSEASDPDAASSQAQSEDELSIDPVEPDFTVVNLPTTARLPKHKAAFRVTHRFARPLGQGDFGDLVQDFFGFDAGAQIGLEFRFAPVGGGQVRFYRTSDRTIQFSGEYNLVRQSEASPLGLSLVAGVEGADNFKKHRVPNFGFVVSRKLGSRLALYASPLWLREPAGNDGHLEHAHEAENVFVAGYGGRLRLTSSAYLVGEWVPRLDSKAVLKNHITVGIEKGVGGHAFQLNVSNAVGTTYAQIARGANNYDDWFIGFNISRKFY